jgi:beta-lactam-binding protein with PASTA domain
VVKCVVPKVVGMTLGRAKAAIVGHHCRVGTVTHAFSPKKKRGRVLAQTPRAGRKLPKGTKVKLVVGKGPRPKPKR